MTETPDGLDIPVANEERGEVALQIGDVHLLIAVTFAGLSRLSKEVDATSSASLTERLLGFDLYVAPRALVHLAVDPDGHGAAMGRVRRAIAVMTMADEADWRVAMDKALSHHVEAGRALRTTPPDLVDEVLGAEAPGKPDAAPG